MPWDLVWAIEHANRIIDWHEHLSQDEMPPEWMWPLDHEINIWFERVAEEREEKYGGGSKEEKAPMMGNEMAKGRGR